MAPPGIVPTHLTSLIALILEPPKKVSMKVEAGKAGVPGQPCLHREFKASLRCLCETQSQTSNSK